MPSKLIDTFPLTFRFKGRCQYFIAGWRSLRVFRVPARNFPLSCFVVPAFHLACTVQMEICSVARWTLPRMLWRRGGHKVCKSPGFARLLGEVLLFFSFLNSCDSNQSKVKCIKWHIVVKIQQLQNLVCKCL